jgi:hypothetical protein
MFRISRSFALSLVLCSSLLAGAFSCSTAQPQANEEPSQSAQGEPTQVAPALDAEVVRYLVAQDAPVVFKVDMERFDEQVAPTIEPLLSSPMAPPGARDMLKTFQKVGLAAPALAMFENPDDVELIDRTRPAYVSAGMLAPESYWKALRYGAVLQPDRANPEAMYLRILLPADDPKAVVDKLRTELSTAQQTLVATAGTRFVVVDVAFADNAASADILSGRSAPDTDADVDVRMTPALARFAATKAPVAAYLRSDLVRLHSAARGMHEARQALELAGPEMRPRMLARGIALGLNDLAVTPTAEREHEDAVVELRADNASGLVVDMTSTLTERGREVAAVAADTHMLNQVPTADAPGLRHIASLRWNYDLLAARKKVPTTIVDGGRGPFQNEAALAEAFRAGGIYIYLSVLTSAPLVMPRAFATLTPDHYADALPRAGAIDVSLPEGQERPSELDIGVFGKAAFSGGRAESVLAPALSKLRKAYSRTGRSVQMDFDKQTASQAPTTLRMRIGAEETRTEDEVELEAGAVDGWLDVAALVSTTVSPKMADQLGAFGVMRAKVDFDDEVSRIRVHFGSGELTHPDIPTVADFQPARASLPCVDGLIADSLSMFEALERVPPDASVESLLNMSSFMDDGADKCAKKHPELAEDIALTKARMRQLALFRLSFVDRPEAESAVRKAMCDLGDELQCAAPDKDKASQ